MLLDQKLGDEDGIDLACRLREESASLTPASSSPGARNPAPAVAR